MLSPRPDLNHYRTILEAQRQHERYRDLPERELFVAVAIDDAPHRGGASVTAAIKAFLGMPFYCFAAGETHIYIAGIDGFEPTRKTKIDHVTHWEARGNLSLLDEPLVVAKGEHALYVSPQLKASLEGQLDTNLLQTHLQDGTSTILVGTPLEICEQSQQWLQRLQIAGERLWCQYRWASITEDHATATQILKDMEDTSHQAITLARINQIHDGPAYQANLQWARAATLLRPDYPLERWHNARKEIGDDDGKTFAQFQEDVTAYSPVRKSLHT